MSSLLSGIGVVFGSISLNSPGAVEEEGEGEGGSGSGSDSDGGQEPLEMVSENTFNVPHAPEILSPGGREQFDPETVSVESGSEDFESADGGSWSPSGRRTVGSRSSKRSALASEAFATSNSPTNPDFSSVHHHHRAPTRRPSSRASAARSPDIEQEFPHIAFGYAYDSPVFEEPVVTSLEADEAEPSRSVQQLVRKSWRLERPISVEVTPEEATRIWNRTADRLAIHDEGLSVQMADLVDAKLNSRSSYAPSSRPFASPTSSPQIPESPQFSPPGSPSPPLPSSSSLHSRPEIPRYPSTASTNSSKQVRLR